MRIRTANKRRKNKQRPLSLRAFARLFPEIVSVVRVNSDYVILNWETHSTPEEVEHYERMMAHALS